MKAFLVYILNRITGNVNLLLIKNWLNSVNVLFHAMLRQNPVC